MRADLEKLPGMNEELIQAIKALVEKYENDPVTSSIIFLLIFLAIIFNTITIFETDGIVQAGIAGRYV